MTTIVEAARMRNTSVNMAWMYTYCFALFFSCSMTMLAACHMRKLGGDMVRSTVRFVIAMFLLCSTLHALAGGVFYAYLIHAVSKVVDRLTESSGSRAGPANADITTASHVLRHDRKRDGGEAAYIPKLSQDSAPLNSALTAILLAENLFFILSAYWIFLLSSELFKLAMRTLDRGKQNEKATIVKYVWRGWVIVALFLGAGLAIVIVHDGYNRTYKYLSFVELGGIVLSVLYATGALVWLRFAGRKHEHIHGVVLASPLYRRLKLLLIVCTVFTLPYSILQLALLCMPQHQIDAIPDYFVGVVTMLYYLFGAAQALVMGGSQQCCMRIVSPIMPTHVKNSQEWVQLRANRRHDPGAIYDFNAPEKPVFVNTDIEGSSALWARAPESVIDTAQDLHDDLLRSFLPKYHGYEITTAGDAFQLAFYCISDAVNYCLEVQLRLLQVKWPSALEGLVPAVKTEVVFGLKPQVLFRGLRVRMGIHDTSVEVEGNLIMQTHRVTGKALYIGASEYIAREIGDMGFGGQIIVSKRVATWLQTSHNAARIRTPFKLDYFGQHSVKQLDLDLELYELMPKNIHMRRKIYRKRALMKGETAQDDSIRGTDTEEPTGEDDFGSGVDYTSQQTPTARLREKIPTVVWQSLRDR